MDSDARGVTGEHPGWTSRARPVGGAHTDRGSLNKHRVIVHAQTSAADDLIALREGLLQAEAGIEPKFFYDNAGCALFARICRLPEYYLTRTEAAIFHTHRQKIAACLPAQAQWIDLGCGDGAKSRPWLEAIAARRFVGVDIAQDSLTHAVRFMSRNVPHIDCLGIVADLSRPLELHAVLAESAASPRIFFYPGSSLGNFAPTEARSLLRSIRNHLDDDGCLLIGVDLIKDVSTLEAAYNDAQGVTAAFNRNVLHVVNRLLNATFDPAAFEHRANFRADANRIEMRLRTSVAQRVRIGGATRDFSVGESILTEYSHKYSVDRFLALLDGAGFSRHRLWTDQRHWYGVFLAQP